LTYFRMVLSSWNREVGMGPIGKESSFSTVTSSLHVVSANARRNISSGLMYMNKKTRLKCWSGETVQGNINPELIFRHALALTTCRDDVTQRNINPELIFRRALALTTCRDDVTVEKLLSFPIGPIPTSVPRWQYHGFDHSITRIDWF
jgi:hypothetical protein